MEIKIEVGEEKFRDVLEKELAAFTQEELHEICRKALIQQMSDPAVFDGLFIDKSDRWRTYSANDILRDAAKTINFDDTYKEIQDGIVSYIKEHHMEILHEMAIGMFIEGLSKNVFYSDSFRRRLNEELCQHNNV